MSSRPTIRAATADDTAGILRLWRTSDRPPSVTDNDENVMRAISSSAVIVADDDGEIVGSLITTFDGWRGNMYRLAVAPAQRRAGLGVALVREGERRLRELGCRRVTALVFNEDPAAPAFWAAAGYRVDEGVVRFVKSIDP